MAQYRKKPVIIEAQQYKEVNWHYKLPLPEGVCTKADYGGENYSHIPHIHTPEGDMWLTDGDWVIKGAQGEYYPCKPDIFEQTYEAV